MKKINWTVIIIVLIIASFLIGYGEMLMPRQKNIDLTAACQGETLQNKEITEIKPLGDSKAKVILEVYSDYQCPACSHYYSNTIKQLITDYVETNKIALVYNDIAFEGNRSQWAAEAGHCANDQDKFWEYHDKIMSLRYQTNNTDVYEKASLITIAQQLGLDVCEFSLCLDSGKYTQLVKDNTNAAFKKITGTPTSFINGKMISDDQGQNLGAMKYEVLKAKIDEALTKIQ